MNLQFEPDFSENSTELSPEESHHVRTVLRKKSGDLLHITNGKGGYFQCRITEVTGKKCLILIEQKEQHIQPINICLAISVLKTSERMEWLIEKATEIGVTSIRFFLSMRTERKNLNLEKLHHVAVGALKQCGRLWLPDLRGPERFTEVLETTADQKFIATLSGHSTPHLIQICKPKQPACILIGPEGDFSEDEVKRATEQGFKSVTLGDYTLRAETAGLVAVQNIVTSGFI